MEISKPDTYRTTIANSVNTLRPRQNGYHFADNIFKYVFVNENVRISIKISLKFVPKSPFNNISALVEIMAWHRPGTKPISGPMKVSLLTHLCVTRPQWVNLRLNPSRWALSLSFKVTMTCWRHIASEMLFNIDAGNALLPDGTKALPEPMLTYHQWGSVCSTHLWSILQEVLKI